MKIQVTLVNAFTADGQGGNPAGIVFNADKLSATQKLKIAQAVGYSETAFVCDHDEVDYAVSFFTTTGEVDFCGHATLAVFSTLYKLGKLTVGSYLQETKAGILSVLIEENGKVIMEQQLPKKLACFSYQDIANVIGLDSQILATTELPIEAISTGLSDLIIPFPCGYLDLIQPNDETIAAFCKQHKLVGLHVFELCGAESNFSASCRNFAPLVGISEESATGSASGALACYFNEHLSLADNYIFEQGRAMHCRSVISASVESNNGIITKVKVGGFANQISTVDLTI